MNQNRRRKTNIVLASAALAGLTAFAGKTSVQAVTIPGSIDPPSAEQSAWNAYSFSYDNVLGTSLDLIVRAPNAADAIECERQALAEIERLRLILSTYDPMSEISRVKYGAAVESNELAELLDAYADWNDRSGGAINGNMGRVIQVWRHAAATGVLPTDSELQDALRSPAGLNVDALGKGFIIDRAVAVAQRIAPAGLLNIGGDVRVWGDYDWTINVADPMNPADNGPALTTIALRNKAIATSGGYARFSTINGQRYSHIIDPRTLRPADQVSSATVVAADCVIANALSTATSVLGVKKGQDLIRQTGATEFVLVDSNGALTQGGVIGAAPARGPERVNLETAAASTAWPKDFQVSVEIALKGPDGGGAARGYKRPYLSVWIENSSKTSVRTVVVWGNQPKYLRELSYWLNFNGTDRANMSAVTRATRPAGKYSVIWDGKDDAGKPLPAGQYTVHVEINREHGRHVQESAVIQCGETAQSAKLKATAESDESNVQYGPRSQ